MAATRRARTGTTVAGERTLSAMAVPEYLIRTGFAGIETTKSESINKFEFCPM